MQCPDCDAGYSKTYNALARHVNSLMWDRTVESDERYEKVTSFLCGRSAKGRGFGHDSLDARAAIMKLGQLAGLPEGWQSCERCKGSGQIENESASESGLMYEDELPDSITDEQYNRWYEQSLIVDGVRMGPKI